MLIGYVRVSKSDGSQTLAPQRDALLAAGVASERIYQDLASGRHDARPGLPACLKSLQPGNTLVLWKLEAHRRTAPPPRRHVPRLPLSCAGTAAERSSVDALRSASDAPSILQAIPESNWISGRFQVAEGSRNLTHMGVPIGTIQGAEDNVPSAGSIGKIASASLF